MVVTAKKDLIENARVTEQGGQVMEVVQPVFVEGLTAGTQMLEEALSDSAVPQPGAIHPDASANNRYADQRVEDRAVSPDSNTKALVLVTYRWAPSTLKFISGGSGVESVLSERLGSKLTDNPIILTHPNLTKDSTDQRRQGAQIDVTVPRMTLTGIVSIALDNGESDAVRHVRLFVNKVNAGAFTEAGGNDDTHQWLITSGDYVITARNASGVATRARFTFTFQHKEEGWRPIRVVAKRNDGTPFPDVETQTGAIVDVEWYDEIPFAGISVLP